METDYPFFRKGKHKAIKHQELSNYIRDRLLEFNNESYVVSDYIDLVISKMVSLAKIAESEIKGDNIFDKRFAYFTQQDNTSTFVPDDLNCGLFTSDLVEKHLQSFFPDDENMRELARKLLYKEFDYVPGCSKRFIHYNPSVTHTTYMNYTNLSPLQPMNTYTDISKYKTLVEYPHTTKMYIRPISEYCGNLNIRTDYSWEEIKEIMVSYFESRNIKYNTSNTTAAFTIVGTPVFSELNFSITAYIEESGSFVIDFHCYKGNKCTASDIFLDLEKLLDDKISLEELNQQYFEDKKATEERINTYTSRVKSFEELFQSDRTKK